MTIYFENLMDYVLFMFLTHMSKFVQKSVLFTIRLIKLYFIHNFRLQKYEI